MTLWLPALDVQAVGGVSRGPSSTPLGWEDPRAVENVET